MPRLALLLLVSLLATGCAGVEFSKDPAVLQQYEGNAQAQLFTVTGCVTHPGKFRLATGQTLTLSEALQKAGGTINGDYFTGNRSSALNDIRVRRLQGGSVIEFKVTLFPGKSGDDFRIKPGDSILVPELL